MKTKSRKKLEYFEVTSGSVTFGDPCYPNNPECKARNGRWVAHVVCSDEGSWGVRVKKVIVHHEGFNPAASRMKSEVCNFGVDSGQAGVFDRGNYGGDEFYDRCCGRTLSKLGYGYTEAGFVSSSGYGDGVYAAEVTSVGGEAVCVELTFIPDED